MAHEEYCTILQKCVHSPPTFAVKLLSVLFSENELFNKNISGKTNTGKDKLNPMNMNAIIEQINLQFPKFMEDKTNSEKIWVAINGKCRKTTEKLNRNIFQYN